MTYPWQSGYRRPLVGCIAAESIPVDWRLARKLSWLQARPITFYALPLYWKGAAESGKHRWGNDSRLWGCMAYIP